MGVYNVPVVLSIDEEKIAAQIEKEAEIKILDKLNEKIEKEVFGYRGYYGTSPAKDMAETIIKELIKECKDEIIQGAIKELAANMVRTKAVKEAVNKTIREVTEE